MEKGENKDSGQSLGTADGSENYVTCKKKNLKDH